MVVMSDSVEYPVEIDQRLVLKERVKAYLLKIAPKSATKETMRQLLLVDLDDMDGTDLGAVLKELWRERYVHTTYSNYYYLTDKRIEDLEKKKPGYRLEVDFYRNGGAAEKKEKKGTEPFTNDWCKAVIQSPFYASDIRDVMNDNIHQIVRMLSRIAYGEVSHLPMNNEDFNEEEANKYDTAIKIFIDSLKEEG